MSCLYCELDGKCSMFTPGIEQGGIMIDHDEEGNEIAYCVCESDPYPGDTCEYYEPDEPEEDEEEDECACGRGDDYDEFCQCGCHADDY